MKRKNAVSDTIAIIKKECAGIEIKTGKEIHSINNDVISTGIEKLAVKKEPEHKTTSSGLSALEQLKARRISK